MGSDDFTAQVFKYYASEQTPLLLSTYNEAFEKRELPKALTTKTLKQDTDPYDCKNFNPISLISLDTNIFT